MDEHMKYYMKEVASRCRIKTGEHVINFTDENNIVYVECVDFYQDKYDGILVETLQQQIDLLDRMAKQCHELLPPYTPTTILYYEQEYNVQFPPLLRYHLLNVSRQLMSDVGTEKYVNLEAAEMFSMRAITEKELENKAIHDMIYDDILNHNSETLLLRLYKTEFCEYDLIVKGVGYGMIVHRQQAQYSSVWGYMDDLATVILTNKYTYDQIFSHIYDQW